MKENADITKAKEEWVINYLTQHPSCTTNKCTKLIRKKFVHGLGWDTVHAIRQRMNATPKAAIKVAGTLKLAKQAGFHNIAQSQAPKSQNHDDAFQDILTGFRRSVTDKLKGVVLRTLSVTTDDNGKWNVEYQLEKVTSNKLTLND